MQKSNVDFYPVLLLSILADTLLRLHTGYWARAGLLALPASAAVLAAVLLLVSTSWQGNTLLQKVLCVLERVGTDMEMLSNELEKCIGYVGESKLIDVPEVDAIGSGVTVSKMFDMIDAVALGEKNRAMKLYEDLYTNKESPMSILFMFSRHINILLQVKECKNRGLRSGEIAKKCGVPPFTIPKYEKQAALFKRSKLLAMLQTRLELEEQFKSGKLSDQLAVELFLIEALNGE